MVERLTCQLEGGLLLADKELLSRWRESPPTDEFDLEGEFSIALDVFGKTDQKYQWPDEDWETVWRRETQGLVSCVNRGEIAVLLLHEGEFFVDLAVNASAPEVTGVTKYQSCLNVPSGILAIAEIGTFIPYWGVKSFPQTFDSLVYREIALPSGSYTASFLVPKDAPIVQKGRLFSFGNEKEPALYVRLNCLPTSVDQIDELFRVNMTRSQ
jgi:hypothetical protein